MQHSSYSILYSDNLYMLVISIIVLRHDLHLRDTWHRLADLHTLYRSVTEDSDHAASGYRGSRNDATCVDVLLKVLLRT